MGDAAGNFTAAVVGELRNIDCGRGRAVALPADAEGGGPASRPFVDCLRCLDELCVEVDKSGLVESLDIDGEMSGDGEAERGFDDWPIGGNNRGLLELLISSGSCDIDFDTVGVPFPHQKALCVLLSLPIGRLVHAQNSVGSSTCSFGDG
jgi:hypothetical protein